MSERINVADLPEFDAAPYFDSEDAIAAYLTDILEANDAALLASALGDIARAQHERDCQGCRNYPRSAVQGAAPRQRLVQRFDTVNRVCTALGARLVAQPVHS
jgi:probable addiction module antidote protein